MRQWATSWRRTRRPGLAVQVLSAVLAVTLQASIVQAEAPVAQPRNGGPADQWTSPAGVTAPGPASDDFGTPPADAEQGGAIQVELRADSPGVRLDRVSVDGRTTPLCFAPCHRLLPRNTEYVIGGDGIPPTSRFLLPDDRAQVALNVRAGSTLRRGTGGALLLSGVVIGYLGLAFVDAGLLSSAADRSGPRSINSAEVVGGVMMLGGLLASIGGLVMVLSSSTKVSSSTGATFTNDERPRPRPAVALTPRGLVF